MPDVFGWIDNNGIASVILYMVFANAIGALPTPATQSSGFYQWFYKFTNGILQVLAANATRVPQVRAFMGLQENPTTPAGFKAEAAAKSIDPAIEGVVMKIDPPEKKEEIKP